MCFGGWGVQKAGPEKVTSGRPRGSQFFLGQAGCTQTWTIREASFERVARGRSEKTERDVPLEAGFTQQIALDGKKCQFQEA